MSKIVLILGASGKIGRHSANAFKLAGWNVRIFDRSKDDIVESSKGVDVIVNGMNPKGYANWAEDIPKTKSQVILAAKASGATVIIPGNIYVYGERSGLLDENTPHNAKTRKGRIRIEMEAEYKKASYEGVQSIILRAGDFIDTGPSDTMMGALMLSKVDKGIVQSLGSVETKHSYCYLPDWAGAAVLLAEKRDDLSKFEDIPFDGVNISAEELAKAVSNKLGRNVKAKRFPWFILYLLSPFWKVAFEMLEMRYLYELDHDICGEKLKRILPEFIPTDKNTIMVSELANGSTV
jgi:nucleoside-diphosphate-sugar epimerase